MEDECSEVLPSLKLRHLRLDAMHVREDSIDSPKPLSAIARTSTLTSLRLMCCVLSAEVGTELIAGLPALEKLELANVYCDDGTLECMKQSSSLRHLTLRRCHGPGITEDSLSELHETEVEVHWTCEWP